MQTFGMWVEKERALIPGNFWIIAHNFLKKLQLVFPPLSRGFCSCLSIHAFSESLERTIETELSSVCSLIILCCRATFYHASRALHLWRAGILGCKVGQDMKCIERGFQMGNWLRFLSISICFQWAQLYPCQEGESLFYDCRALRKQCDGRRSNCS